MTVDFITGQDVAALQLFIPSSRRVNATLNELWLSIRPILIPWTVSTDWYGVMPEDDSAIENKRYFSVLGGVSFRDSRVSVGFRYPTLSDRFPKPSEGIAQLYIRVGTDRNMPALSERMQLPDPWRRYDTELLAALDLNGLSDSLVFIERAKRWLTERVVELTGELERVGLLP